MKTLIIPLVMFLALTACEEETERPLNSQDPFVGSWRLDNSTNPELDISFDIENAEEGLTFRNIQIIHPDVSEPLTYSADTYYRFSPNTGYKRITLKGQREGFSVTVTMLHNRIHLMEQDELKVWIMEIDIRDKPLIELNDQVFVKL